MPCLASSDSGVFARNFGQDISPIPATKRSCVNVSLSKNMPVPNFMETFTQDRFVAGEWERYPGRRPWRRLRCLTKQGTASCASTGKK